MRDDVAFGPANLGLSQAEIDDRVTRALDSVGMAEHADRPPHHLSFGQRRRVAVATVLAMDPDVLVLDEPSSNLDPASRRELADIVLGLDLTLLMVTHDLPYALEICPRSVIMNDGVIVADGPTAAVLRTNPSSRPTASSSPTASRCLRHSALGLAGAAFGNRRPLRRLLRRFGIPTLGGGGGGG